MISYVSTERMYRKGGKERIGACMPRYICGGPRTSSGVVGPWLPSCLRGLTTVEYARPTGSGAPWDFPVSASHLTTGTLSRRHMLTSNFTWVRGIWIHVLVLEWYAHYPLSHLPSPDTTDLNLPYHEFLIPVCVVLWLFGCWFWFLVFDGVFLFVCLFAIVPFISLAFSVLVFLSCSSTFKT